MFNFHEHIETLCAEQRTELGNTKISEIYRQIGDTEFLAKTGIYTICGKVSQTGIYTICGKVSQCADGGYSFAGTCVIGSEDKKNRLWHEDTCILDIVYTDTEASTENKRLSKSAYLGAWASVGITILLAALSLRCAGFL
jgi:hypothetical protein